MLDNASPRPALDLTEFFYRREASGTLMGLPSASDYHFGPEWIADLLDALRGGASISAAIDLVSQSSGATSLELLVGLHDLVGVIFANGDGMVPVIQPLADVLPEYAEHCGTFGMPL